MTKKPVNLLKITEERWKEAQQWESSHWIQGEKYKKRCGKDILYSVLVKLGLKPVYHGDDYNYWWKAQFNDYNFLPPVLENVIELGCGPYTNLRLILQRCRAKHIFLNDPLIKAYIHFSHTFVSDFFRKKQFLILDDHLLEQCPFAPGYFDLVVLINVLEHVKDAELCLKNAMNITKSGGLLLIGQDLTDEEDMELLKGNVGEVGHPIKIGHDWLDQITQGKFEPILYKVLPRHEGRTGLHYGTYIFAGRKM